MTQYYQGITLLPNTWLLNSSSICHPIKITRSLYCKKANALNFNNAVQLEQLEGRDKSTVKELSSYKNKDQPTAKFVHQEFDMALSEYNRHHRYSCICWVCIGNPKHIRDLGKHLCTRGNPQKKKLRHKFCKKDLTNLCF